MSTQEGQEIIIDYYKFKNFRREENSVVFAVECENKEVDVDNRAEIESFLKDIGKWDCLVYSGVFLLSDLKNIYSTQKNNPEKYLTKFGVDLYKPALVTIEEKKEKTDNCILKIKIDLNETELQKRLLQKYPALLVDEIIKQVENIPKWIVFQKTLRNLREVKP
jgi:bifunctional N-acetylglucosamine-1-phosphate-uridyltransferase/glucosamine-1-phosphate-acetyltransferase GlmU-like protein